MSGGKSIVSSSKMGDTAKDAPVEAKLTKLLGLVFAALGLGALAYDYWRGPHLGGEMEFSSIAEGWATLHRDSLIGLNSFTEKNLSPDVWDNFVLPALNWNAALTFILLALVFLYMGKGSGGSRRRGMFSKNGRR